MIYGRSPSLDARNLIGTIQVQSVDHYIITSIDYKWRTSLMISEVIEKSRLLARGLNLSAADNIH